MSDDLLLNEIRDLAARWRYEFGNEQQMSDGLELLQLLKRHGVPWPSDKATEVVAEPALVVVVPCAATLTPIKERE